MAILSSMFGGRPTRPGSVNQVMPYGGTPRMGAAPGGMGGIGGIPGGMGGMGGTPGAPGMGGMPGGMGNPTGTGMSHMATPTGQFLPGVAAANAAMDPAALAAYKAGWPAQRFAAKYNNPFAFNNALTQGGIDPGSVNAGNWLDTYNSPYTNQSQANPWTRQHAPQPGMMAGLGQLFPNIAVAGAAGQDFRAKDFMNFLRGGGNGLDYTGRAEGFAKPEFARGVKVR